MKEYQIHKYVNGKNVWNSQRYKENGLDVARTGIAFYAARGKCDQRMAFNPSLPLLITYSDGKVMWELKQYEVQPPPPTQEEIDREKLERQSKLLGEVRLERKRQDRLGRTEFDMMHSPIDWFRIMSGYLIKSMQCAVGVRRRIFVSVAAICLAAIEAIDRMRENEEACKSRVLAAQSEVSNRQ